MRGFFKYFCMYCASRLLFSAVGNQLRKKPATAPKPCAAHERGILLTVVLLPYLLGACALFYGWYLSR
jgi:hypothetical protein